MMLFSTLTAAAQERTQHDHKPAEKGLCFVNPHKGEHHARWWVGGSFTYWRDTDKKVNVVSIRPEVGHFIAPKWGIGLMGNYTVEGGHERSYGFNVFARRYVLHHAPFNVYFDGGMGLSWEQAKHHGQWGDSQLGYEVGIRPGVCVDLAKGFCLCLRTGFIGWRKSFASGEEPELTHSGFGLRFAPEELQIGLELEF